jgi:hypothetical protein
VFRPDGRPLSRKTGLTAGPISWPQSTVSDREGNIWLANCAADSVTLYPKGRPGKALEIPIPPPVNASARMKTFGIAIDHRGNAWTTGSLNSTLAVIGPEGNVLEVIPPQGPQGRTQLSRPMGVASDSRGNIWVANSAFMDVPCPPATSQGRLTAPESYTPRHLAERILTSKAALEGERKQVTVVFADLKGSMELLADRDPEEARQILDPVLARMMEAVHRYEGTVNHPNTCPPEQKLDIVSIPIK